MKKVVHIVSDSGHRDRQVLYEQTIRALKKECDLTFIILGGNISLTNYCEKVGVKVIFYAYAPKNIFEVFRYILKLHKVIRSFDIVHCHYFDANLTGLLAAYLARVPQRIYTRHHNTFYHDIKDKKTVLWNKLFNRLSTQIIAPSNSVLETLNQLEHVPKNKISVIYHPFEHPKKEEQASLSVQEISMKYHIPISDKFIVGVVSTFQTIKGVEYIIEAFATFHKKYPQTFLVLANATGPNEKKINNKLLELKGSAVKIPYENNIETLYKTFNVVVHTPISETAEAFGQVFVESMALGIPGIFTAAGVLPEVAEDGFNCLVVPFKNSAAISERLEKLLNNKNLREQISANAKIKAAHIFNLHNFRSKLKFLYNL